MGRSGYLDETDEKKKLCKPTTDMRGQRSNENGFCMKEWKTSLHPALGVALSEKDREMANHCDRVALLCGEFAGQLRLSASDADMLQVIAAMHDMGKIGIPDDILQKPGSLEKSEWEIMKTHSTRGERIVRAAQLDGVERISKVVRHHHEHFDGSGYPDRLHGDSIPLLARILAVVDGYDAMTTRRSYRKAYSHSHAMEILASESGTMYDPLMVSVFERLIEYSPNRAPI